jgi:hypothetical protein
MPPGLVGKKGRSEPQEIRFCTHIPKISDLTILWASESSVNVKFQASDDAGDITDENRPSCVFVAVCLPAFIFASGTKATKVTATDAKNTVIEATLNAAYPNRVSEGCELKLSITDKEGNQSNTLKTKIQFTKK